MISKLGNYFIIFPHPSYPLTTPSSVPLLLAVAPTNLIATTGIDSVGPYIQLSFNFNQGNSGTPLAFKIELSDSPSSTGGNGDGGGFRWKPAMTLPPNVTGCKLYNFDANQIGGRSLTYVLRSTSVNDAGFAGTQQNTSYSNEVTVLAPAQVRPIPGNPTRVQATAGSTISSGIYGAGIASGIPINISVLPADSTTLHLAWNQTDSNESQFDIRYSTDNSTWTTISGATSSLVTRYALSGLTQSTFYYVQVRATNENGSSSWIDLTTGPSGNIVSPVSTFSGTQIYSIAGTTNPPGFWNAQKDWGVRQAYSDYNSNPNVNDAAKQFTKLVASANKYANSPPNGTQTNTPDAPDIGMTNIVMYRCTGSSIYIQNIWNREFNSGVTANQSICGGVGWDGTIMSAPSTGVNSVWSTNLNLFTTTVNDVRIKGGRVLFLTGGISGQHIQILSNDASGNITIGSPTIPLTAAPSSGDLFQMIPYWMGGSDNYHAVAGIYLDIIMIMWPWFDNIKIRQITNMLNWWADSHIQVDQAGTLNLWQNTMGSHDDNLVGATTPLIIDQCIPNNPWKGRWINPSNWGPTIGAPLCQSGTLNPTGRTSNTFGYCDTSSFRNCINRYAIIGRGGRYIVGDEYDPSDIREASNAMEIAQTVLGVDYWPEWRKLWVDFIKMSMYQMIPNKSIQLIVGDWQSTSFTPGTTYPSDRSLSPAAQISKLKQVAGAVRGHPNAAYLYQFTQEWQSSLGYGSNSDLTESYIQQDWYPNPKNWRNDFPYGYFSEGNGTLYFQNGWGSNSGCYCINFFAERATDHAHIFTSNIHIGRKGTFAFSEPIGYGGHMNYGNPQTNSPMHCGIGPMWVAGVESYYVDNNYGYVVWSTHGNYYPPKNPSSLGPSAKSVERTTNTTQNVDTFALEGTRSVLVLPGKDSLSEIIIICDRMWDINPRLLPNWGNSQGYAKKQYVANPQSLSGIAAGYVTGPPTANTITPTTTQFSTNYTAASLNGYKLNFLTGNNAGQYGYLVYTAASAVPVIAGTGYQIGDLLTLGVSTSTSNSYGWSMAQSGTSLLSSYFINPAIFSVSSTGINGAVSSVSLTNSGVYVALAAGTSVHTIGGNGSNCTLSITYTNPWNASTNSVNIYPPLPHIPATGDIISIEFPLYEYNVITYSDALQALSFHAPTLPTLSGNLLSWTLPQDNSQQCSINILYPTSPSIYINDESDNSKPAIAGGYNFAGGYLTPAEINYQIEVQPNNIQFPGTTGGVYNSFLSLISAYDSGYAPTSTLISSNGGEAVGAFIQKPNNNDNIVMFSIIKGYRIHQNGYTFNYNSNTSSQNIYICDLDPSKNNSYMLDGGSSNTLITNKAGVASFIVPSTGNHTIQLTIS